MIRIASQPKPATPRWHRQFLAMLPAIITHAKIAFRHLRPEARSESVAEATANALKAFVRLVELGKADIAYAGPLARYAVAQVRDGRKVGGRLNIKDVLSPYCQVRKNVKVERLDHFDEEENAWTEVLVEDRTAGPADIARVHLDFAAWLKQLPRRNRRIAEFLSVGHRTQEAANKFRLSEGRVSQLRAELAESWRQFVGDEPEPLAA